MPTPSPIPLPWERMSETEMRERSAWLLERLSSRRSVRDFSEEPIPLDVVRRAIHAAAQSPSGAGKQPWTFVLVTDPETKGRIRSQSEEVERAFYAGRAGETWLRDLEPIGTSGDKSFLERAPALIVVFAQVRAPGGGKHYYVSRSVGIACGVLLASLHLSGLATLTYTPSPMDFLRDLLGRPPHEMPYLVIPVGYPAPGCTVPDLRRKGLAEVLVER